MPLLINIVTALHNNERINVPGLDLKSLKEEYRVTVPKESHRHHVQRGDYYLFFSPPLDSLLNDLCRALEDHFPGVKIEAFNGIKKIVFIDTDVEHFKGMNEQQILQAMDTKHQDIVQTLTAKDTKSLSGSKNFEEEMKDLALDFEGALETLGLVTDPQKRIEYQEQVKAYIRFHAKDPRPEAAKNVQMLIWAALAMGPKDNDPLNIQYLMNELSVNYFADFDQLNPKQKNRIVSAINPFYREHSDHLVAFAFSIHEGMYRWDRQEMITSLENILGKKNIFSVTPAQKQELTRQLQQDPNLYQIVKSAVFNTQYFILADYKKLISTAEKHVNSVFQSTKSPESKAMAVLLDQFNKQQNGAPLSNDDKIKLFLMMEVYFENNYSYNVGERRKRTFAAELLDIYKHLKFDMELATALFQLTEPVKCVSSSLLYEKKLMDLGGQCIASSSSTTRRVNTAASPANNNNSNNNNRGNALEDEDDDDSTKKKVTFGYQAETQNKNTLTSIMKKTK